MLGRIWNRLNFASQIVTSVTAAAGVLFGIFSNHHTASNSFESAEETAEIGQQNSSRTIASVDMPIKRSQNFKAYDATLASNTNPNSISGAAAQFDNRMSDFRNDSGQQAGSANSMASNMRSGFFQNGMMSQAIPNDFVRPGGGIALGNINLLGSPTTNMNSDSGSGASPAGTAASGLAATSGTQNADSSVIKAVASSPSKSSLISSPATLFADGVTPATVIVHVVDANGSTASNKTITLSSNPIVGVTISPAYAVTNASGNASFEVTSTYVGVVNISAYDKTDSFAVSATTSVQFDSYVASAALSTILNRPVSVVKNGVAQSTVSVTIYNASGTPLPGKSVSLSSSRGTLVDSLLPLTAITSVSGVASFSVQSTTVGKSTLSAHVAADSVTLAQNVYVLFLPVAPLSDWQPELAGGTFAGANSPAVSKFLDLVSLTSNQGTLFNFSFIASNGWSGDGTNAIISASTGPHRLSFDGTADYVIFGTGLNSVSGDFSNEIWARPGVPTARGTVLFSNGDSNSHGLTLRQSWDGTGKVQLTLGNQSYADSILALSPIGFWRLGESSGTTAFDSSGFSRNGTYSGGYVIAPTGALAHDSDRALSLNGTNAFVANINLPPAATGDWSEVAWIKTLSTSAGVIMTNRVDQNDVSLSLHIGIWAGNPTANGNIYFSNDGPSCEFGAIGNVNLADGLWHHVAGVRSVVSGTSNYSVYVDGNAVPQGTNNQSIGAGCQNRSADAASNWFIGNHPAWNSSFNGSLDEVAVYNYALTGAQIAALYSSRNNASCTSASAVASTAWNNLISVFSSSTLGLTLFYNGAQECTVTAKAGAAYSGSLNPMSAGASLNSAGSPTSGSYWNGALGDIRTYGTALTPAQVSSIYTAVSPRFP